MDCTGIMLAEQQPLITAGLKYFIDEQKEFTICGEASNKEELFRQLQSTPPRLLIIAYDSLPGFQLQDFHLIRQTAPSIHILAISSGLDKNDILQVSEAGVIGFLTKECSHNEIINAIRATAQGEKFYCGKILDLLMKRSSHREESSSPEQITSREVEIIRCISKGQSSKEIADTLSLSMHTINAYRKSILHKMEARSPAELAVKAIKLGIIEI